MDIPSKVHTQVKKLIDKSKLDIAERIIKNFEAEGGHTLHDIVLCHLLKCELFFWRGKEVDERTKFITAKKIEAQRDELDSEYKIEIIDEGNETTEFKLFIGSGTKFKKW